MRNPQFKPGDRVQVKDNCLATCLVKGREYTIMSSDGELYIPCAEDRPGNRHHLHWCAGYIQSAQPLSPLEAAVRAYIKQELP